MGQAIIHEVSLASDLQLAGICVRQGGVQRAIELLQAAGLQATLPVVSSPIEIIDRADIAIDFSVPLACGSVVAAAVASGTPLVSGVTGLDAAAMASIRAASAKIPVLYDRNMSLGIAVMQKLLQQAAVALGDKFVAAISETHHERKADAPSGTALQLGEALARSRGQEFASVYRYDPDGSLANPSATDIVISARRIGDNPGEHTVSFKSENESLLLMHKVSTRKVFAEGALRAARWLAVRSNGLYNLTDTTA
jgi:4-hydroxy-tetrahydrodipicolinate reductase